MTTRTTYALLTTIILAAFIVGAVAYVLLPGDQVASHWNAAGEVNGYMGKFVGIFLLPLITLGVALLLIFLPHIDPLRENIVQFRREYNLVIAIITITLLLLHISTLAWNFGVRFDMTSFVVAVIGIMLYLLGTIIPKIKRNWFMGIRTPWTLSSDTVWEKTHQQGGLIFKVSGVIAIFGALLPANIRMITITPMIVGALWLVLYSYLEYRKERKIISPPKTHE